MHINVDPQPSCARAWVAAASAIAQPGEGYNVIIGVDDPLAFDDFDNQVIKLVDTFLRDHKHAPISTVVNTLFPVSLYRKFGEDGLVATYRNVYDRLTTKRWGRYFDRMTRRVDGNGETYNPLDKIIEKLKKQNSARTPFKAAYELPLYNPDLDRKRYRDAPCLSFLSFKRHPDRRLSLTAKDGYGYHDAIHLSFAAVLGWSPLTRKLLGVKRRDNNQFDLIERVEDGGRAIATGEGLSTMVFAYARDYNWLEGKASVSTELLRMVKNMTEHLEVSACTPGEWEHAMVQGFAVSAEDPRPLPRAAVSLDVTGAC